MSTFHDEYSIHRASAIPQVSALLYDALDTAGYQSNCISNISLHSPDRANHKSFTCVTIQICTEQYPSDLYEIHVIQHGCNISYTSTIPTYYKVGSHKIANIVQALLLNMQWSSVFEELASL